jgi:hypothetical protein
MEKSNLLNVLLLLACLPSTSSAQDGCASVLSLTGRNFIESSVEFSSAQNIYSNYCSGSTYKSGSATNVGLDVVIEGIPLGVSFFGNSSEEKINNFCSTMSQGENTDYVKALKGSLVSIEAVKAWADCKKYQNIGIAFSPIITIDSVTVDVKKTASDPVRIQGVSAGEGLECSIPWDSASPNASADVSSNTRLELNDSRQWQVQCRRTGSSVGGSISYERTSLTINTSEGSFVLPVPADAAFSAQTASELNRSLEALQNKIAEMSTKMRTTSVSQDCHPSASMYMYDCVASCADSAIAISGRCEVGDTRGMALTLMSVGSQRNQWKCTYTDPRTFGQNTAQPEATMTATAVCLDIQ